MKKNKFNPGIRITIFFAFFAILFFSLGLWQIERGQSKNQILIEFEKNITKNPSYLNANSQKWDRVFVEGTWINSKQIYIDNVIYGGMAGYKVLTPLQIKETNELLLVDRGWIKQNEYRDNLPNINIVEEEVVVTGILELPELGLVLSDDIVTSAWPKVSQTKNLDVLANEYKQPVYPMILVADPVLKNSLEYIKIIPTNMTPVKHYGYSAQWFLMFSVLCLMYVFYGFKRNAK